jgi:hypothetical protein
MNIHIFDDGFTVMPIQTLDEILPARGGTGGLLEPSGIAYHYCGIQTFDVGHLMAYGFRRFGYPANGWDNDKELCKWILVTPMEGVFLTVTPTSVSPFGYLLKNPLTRELSNEQSALFVEWGKHCHKWAKETHGVVLVDSGHWAGQYTDEEFEFASEAWLRKTYPDEYTEESVEQLAKKIEVAVKGIAYRFWHEKHEECRKFADEYKHSHPLPERQNNLRCHVLSDDIPGIPFWKSLPEESLERRMNEAIQRTLFDLKRPVPVRDWQLTIDGKNTDDEFCKYAVDGDGEETDECLYDYSVPTARTTGYGVDLDTVGNKDWSHVQTAFIDQFGSVKAGIQHLAKLLDYGMLTSACEVEMP